MERMADSVVVPAVQVPSTLACLRSLRKRGIRTVVASEKDRPPAFCSRYCDERVRVPSPEADIQKYGDALLRLAEREEVRTIIPVREEDVYVLSKRKEEFANHVGTPWPAFEKLRRVHDRIELYDAARTAGVPVPETHLLTECDDWSRRWIVKGRYALLTQTYLDEANGVSSDGGSVGTQVERMAGVANPPSTRYLAQREPQKVEHLCTEAGHVPLLQEFLDDTDEYAFFALYDEGEAVTTFQHRQIRGWAYAGGPSAFRKSVHIPVLEENGRKLLDHLDWHGLAMVEFKRDGPTGEFKLMEVNPRFWSSLPFSVQTGADFPFYYWSLATGRRDRIEEGYDVGIGGHLTMGELSYLYSILTQDAPLVERPSFPKELAAIASSLVREPRFDYLDPLDPCPGLRYAYDRVSELWN
jgi:predicted ATP-grasp superfamily ATP-dependent carboligase